MDPALFCLGTDLKVWIVEDSGKKMKSDQLLRRHLGCDHRRSVIGEVVTPMVILLLCDPAVDVFLLHVVPVIQVLPESSSGLSYEFIQMQAGDVIDTIDGKAVDVFQGEEGMEQAFVSIYIQSGRPDRVSEQYC